VTLHHTYRDIFLFVKVYEKTKASNVFGLCLNTCALYQQTVYNTVSAWMQQHAQCHLTELLQEKQSLVSNQHTVYVQSISIDLF